MKSFFKIANSQDAGVIRNLLQATTDITVTNAIPASLFSSLSVNITGIASTNVPPAYVNYFIFNLIHFSLK